MSHILIIIPAYDEEDNVAKVIAGVREALPQAEVLVVNDGSHDRTAAIARQAGAVVVSHPYNMGYAAALQTGYKYARENGHRYVAQIDADGQHDPRCIADLLAPLERQEADVVIGSRFLSEARYGAGPVRRALMRLFAGLASAIIGQRVTDTTSGFQALNRRAFSYCASDVYPTDFADVDTLIMLHRAGLRTREVAVQIYPNTDRASRYFNMHGLMTPAYYAFKMCLSILVTLLREANTATRMAEE